MRIFFLILILIMISPDSHMAYGGSIMAEKDVFFQKESQWETTYGKFELSGCSTRIVWIKKSNRVRISHDRRCKIDREKRESIVEIANSVYEIFTYFNLAERAKVIKDIHINIGWNTNHEPLILFINDDEQWPNNIFEYSITNSPSHIEPYEFYRKIVREEILKSKIYKPFIDVMRKFNCEMTLKDRFTDGLFFNKGKNLTGISLTEDGVFKKGEAKKDVYPFLKGAMEFDLKMEMRSNIE